MLLSFVGRISTGVFQLKAKSFYQPLKRMCVTYFCQSEICQAGGYWLTLANNRDEYWDRPTQLAHFWGPDGSCFSAQDETVGKEGGTWLGLNRKGRVAVLVNILGQDDPTKKGRGSLVSNFISSDIDIHEYASSIDAEKDQYSGFNLVLFDLGKKEESLVCKPVYISNAAFYPSAVQRRALPANTFLGLSNSTLEYPFQKAKNGKTMFGEIVSQYPSVTQKSDLVENIFSMMSDRTHHLPDSILERAGASAGCSPLTVSQYSAINVYSPQARYGTRTTSILLIDCEGKVDFVEKNLDFSKSSEAPDTSINHKSFNLTLNDLNHNELVGDTVQR